MKNDFYVYIYLDPRKSGKFTYANISFLFEPIYVGKGRGKRYLAHLNLKNKSKSYFKSKLTHILSEYSLEDIDKYILIFRNSLREDEAFALEKELILEIGRCDLKTGPLANLTSGGDGTSGLLTSDETRRRRSEAQRGRAYSEETKRKMSKALCGHVVSNETKKKLSEANFGKKLSEKTKRKISEANRGRVQSDESRRKKSEALCGRLKSDKTKRRIGEANRGHVHSDRTKKRISEILRGRVRSNEHIEKIRQSKEKARTANWLTSFLLRYPKESTTVYK